MTRTFKQNISLAAGEISPSLYSRSDLGKYQSGVKLLRNFFVRRDGGADNRPGTSFVCEVKDSTKRTRIIPFEVAATTTYVLEFGDQYMRVVKDAALSFDLTLAITNITKANPAVVTYTGTDPVNGEEIYIDQVLGMTQVNNRQFKIANVDGSGNTFELKTMDGVNLNSTGYTTYSSLGRARRVYTIVTPYTEANLFLLDYAQGGTSPNVMTIVSNAYQIRELTRTSDISWAIAVVAFAPSIPKPTNVTGSAGSFASYVVTAVQSETFEESLPSSILQAGTVAPTPTAQIGITWTAVAGARYYKIYRYTNDVYGFIGPAGDSGTPFKFYDIGVDADTTHTPPDARLPFNSGDLSNSGYWPATVALVGQRRFFANITLDTERVDGSRVGFPKNFTINTPIREDGAITFRLSGDKVNPVKHLANLRGLVVLSREGEFAIGARDSGALTPFALQQDQQSYNGSKFLKPLPVVDRLLYVHNNSKKIFDLGLNPIKAGYDGVDLTAFASHLVKHNTIEHWAYQKDENSIVWIVRDDGSLISMTYLPEQQIVGWARHDLSGGIAESVCSITEGNENFVYLVVKRTVSSRTVRYIERFNTREFDDIVDTVFVDCASTYDGRNTDTAKTMTLSGGTLWNDTEDLTLTLAGTGNVLAATDIGNAIFLTGSDGTVVHAEITGFTSTVIVTVRSDKDVPASMRNVAITEWSRAVDEIGGLWHIEGKSVSVLADGYVVASANNSDYTTLTVSSGKVTLPQPFAVVHVGLAITADIETLDVDFPNADVLVDKQKNIPKLALRVEDSRGGFVGCAPPTDDSTNPVEGLYELQMRDFEDYGTPIDLMNGIVDQQIRQDWTDGGNVFIRQLDPLPLSVLAIYPTGMAYARGL